MYANMFPCPRRDERVAALANKVESLDANVIFVSAMLIAVARGIVFSGCPPVPGDVWTDVDVGPTAFPTTDTIHLPYTEKLTLKEHRDNLGVYTLPQTAGTRNDLM